VSTRFAEPVVAERAQHITCRCQALFPNPPFFSATVLTYLPKVRQVYPAGLLNRCHLREQYLNHNGYSHLLSRILQSFKPVRLAHILRSTSVNKCATRMTLCGTATQSVLCYSSFQGDLLASFFTAHLPVLTFHSPSVFSGNLKSSPRFHWVLKQHFQSETPNPVFTTPSPVQFDRIL